MDLAWLYAWAVFTTSPLMPTVSLPACAATFWLAAVTTRLVMSRGWRVVAVRLLQAAVFLLGVLLVLHGTLVVSHSIWRVGKWLKMLGAWDVTFPRLRLALLCFWVFCIWAGGVKLCRRPLDYLSVTARFDLGVGAFFTLLLIQFLIRVKFGADLGRDTIGYPMMFFIIFGVFGVGLARSRPSAGLSFPDRYRGAGMLLGFAVLLPLAGTAAGLVILAYFSRAAGTAIAGMRVTSTWISRALSSIIKFIFKPLATSIVPVSAGATDAPPATVPEASGRLPILGTILLWLVLGLMGAVTLYLAAKGIAYVIRRLFSRIGSSRLFVAGFSLPLDSWLAALHALFLFLFKRRNALGVVELYTQMVEWGHRSGIPRKVCETPLEYGARLSGRFPEAGREFGTIVAAFNLTVYGDSSEEQAGLLDARGAWRKLLRLWLWMAHLRSLLRARKNRSCEP